MDNNVIISIILYGCELARKLEGSLSSMVDEPTSISESCSEIIKAFMAAKEMLNNHYNHTSLSSDQHPLTIGEDQMCGTTASTVEEWLRPSIYSHGTMDQHMIIVESHGHEHDNLTSEMISTLPCERNQVAFVGGSDSVEGPGKFQMGQSSGSSRPDSSPIIKQRRSRRKETDGWRTVRMAVPTMGNTDIPPEDGFTWRKYGQKEILGSRFHRAYFRCTHQKLYHCPAKKQVQRLDDDPNTFEVTYRNDHTCYMSATIPAPSIILPLSIPKELTKKEQISRNSSVPPMSMQNSRARTTTTSAETWLSMGIGCPRPVQNPNPFIDTRPPDSYNEAYCGDTSGYNYQLMMDMVDTMMFNSGPSGNRCLDQIFSTIAERKINHDDGDKDLNGE